VILDEQTDATKSASSNAGRDTSINLPNPTLFGGALSVKGRNILQIEAEGGTSFSGSGDSSQSNRLTGSVAVTVHEVLPNGTLHRCDRRQQPPRLVDAGIHQRLVAFLTIQQS